MTKIDEKQKIEIEYWRYSKTEAPEANSIHNIVNKVSDAAVLLDCLNRHSEQLTPRKGRVLELGGGQGWAACIYKRLYPETHVTLTDISKYAIMSLPKWERLFEVSIDNSYACTSYEIKEIDASLDLIFCFAAAHHFLAHKRTLHEIKRVLKPGGKAIYFYEPTTPRYLYSFAYRRVNKKRPEVPEDVLVTSDLYKISREVGLDMYVDYYPSLIKKKPFEMIYYYVLSRIAFLQRLLPCTANLIFIKKNT